MSKTISITIRGKVQGVWFRKYAHQKAQQLYITGFVKNLPDQSVYILATGTEEQLKEFVDWCWQGSPKSKVETVIVLELPAEAFQYFSINK